MRPRLKSNNTYAGDSMLALCFGIKVNTDYWKQYALGTFLLAVVGVNLYGGIALATGDSHKRDERSASPR